LAGAVDEAGAVDDAGAAAEFDGATAVRVMYVVAPGVVRSEPHAEATRPTAVSVAMTETVVRHRRGRGREVTRTP
jgi:hypothetical protein